MAKSGNRIILLASVLFLITMLIGCSSKNNSKDNFNIEQFQNEMKARNYNFEIKDVQQDFLPTTRKRMIIDDKAIDIYLFNSNKKMENEARHIDSGGCGYDNGSKSVKVSWVSFPHFYKKGSIIVQYIGEDEKIIADLKDIFGEQFAGYTLK
jgi:hypothetical protein